MKDKKLILVGFVALVVLGMAGVIVFQATRPPKAFRIPDLENEVAKNVEGWNWVDVPIAESPEMQRAIDELLNFDRALFRVYKKGDIEVAVYCAYWTPGKTQFKQIEAHTPDICWVRGGWTREKSESDYVLKVGGEAYQPGEFRIMQIKDSIRYVVYWHLWEGRAFSYNRGEGQVVGAFLYDLWERGLNQKAEQLFIRVSSSVPYAELENDPGFHEIMSSLTGVGLEEPKQD